MNDFWAANWFVFYPFAVFFAVIFVGLILRSQGGAKVCPDCKAPLPLFQSPFTKTKRQWWEGGYLCGNCGCEADISGRKVASGTEPQRRSVVLGMCMLVLAIVPAVVLNGILIAYPHTAPALRATPVHAAPVLRAEPEPLSP